MIEVSLFTAFAEFLDKLPWSILIFLCLTLGLAPFFPPHLFEKKMLLEGLLVRPCYACDSLGFPGY